MEYELLVLIKLTITFLKLLIAGTIVACVIFVFSMVSGMFMMLKKIKDMPLGGDGKGGNA